MVNLLLSELPPLTSSYILDGFPRTRQQAEALAKANVPINFVVNLDVPHSVILKRIANRWVHAKSGRVYNTTFSPPMEDGKDDITGEDLTRRKDDDPVCCSYSLDCGWRAKLTGGKQETFKVRLEQYAETTKLLLDFYNDMGILWKVKGENSDDITPKLLQEVQRRFG